MKIGKRSKAQVNKVRKLVFERDRHLCVVHGSLWQRLEPCWGDLTVQHAVARGMGGSAKWDGIDYLRAMCSHHNTLDTASSEFRKACIRNGWSMPRWLAEQNYPAKLLPVRYSDGWHLLQDGERIRISDATAVRIMSDIYGDEVED